MKMTYASETAKISLVQIIQEEKIINSQPGYQYKIVSPQMKKLVGLLFYSSKTRFVKILTYLLIIFYKIMRILKIDSTSLHLNCVCLKCSTRLSGQFHIQKSEFFLFFCVQLVTHQYLINAFLNIRFVYILEDVYYVIESSSHNAYYIEVSELFIHDSEISSSAVEFLTEYFLTSGFSFCTLKLKQSLRFIRRYVTKVNIPFLNMKNKQFDFQDACFAIDKVGFIWLEIRGTQTLHTKLSTNFSVFEANIY